MVKCFNILCTSKFDCHNFIRREKRGGQRTSFSIILKYVLFIAKKYCSFWLVNLKRELIIKLKVGFTVLPNLKKFTEGNWRNRDKKIANKFRKSRFCKIKNYACENNICLTSITAPQKSSNSTRTKNENYIEPP